MKHQEERLVRFLLYRSAIGNGCSRNDVRYVVKEVLDKSEADGSTQVGTEKLFPDNLPSKTWVHRFMDRHNNISARTPETLGHMRKNVNEDQLREWFTNLENYLLEEHDINAVQFLKPENSHRIFNLDESGFPLGGKNKMKIITEKGNKNVYTVTSENKEQITVLMCASANGSFCKPYVIFPGVRPNYQLNQVDPKDYDLGKSPNGWISSENFFTWFSTKMGSFYSVSHHMRPTFCNHLTSVCSDH